MLLRQKDVSGVFKRQKTAIYGDVSDGLFPPPIKIGARAVAWPESEVRAIIAARIAGKSDDEIRGLVKRLVAARQGVQS